MENANGASPLIVDMLSELPKNTESTQLRVSANNRETLAANAQRAEKKMDRRPSVKALADIGGIDAMTASTPEGVALRKEKGILEVRRRDVHPSADKPTLVIAWLWPVKDPVTGCVDLLLAIADTAAESTLRVDHDPLPRNAASELMVAVLMHPNIVAMHMADWDRWVRSIAHGTRVWDAARRGGCRLWEGDHEVDLYSVGGAYETQNKSIGTAATRDTIRRQTTTGVLSRFDMHEVSWPYQTANAPLGYTVAGRRTNAVHGACRKFAVLVKDEKNAAGWLAFFRAWLSGETLRAASEKLVEHHVECRGVKQAGLTYDRCSKDTVYRAAQTHTSARHYALLRDKRYRAKVGVPVASKPGERWEGYEVDHLDLAFEYGCIDVDVALPAHDIALTDEEFDEWKRLLSVRTSRERTTDQPVKALTGAATWRDGVHDYKLTAQGGNSKWTYYQVRRRPLEQSYLLDEASGTKTERGWQTLEGDLVLSARAADVEAALGRGIVAGAISILKNEATLEVATREKRDEAEDESRRAARLEELGVLVSRAQEDADDAADVIILRGESENRRDRAEDARTTHEALVAERDRLLQASRSREGVRSADVEGTAEVDVASLASVAGLLLSADGESMPRILNDAVRTITNKTLRVIADPSQTGIAYVIATIHWPSLSGETLTFNVREIITLASANGTKGTKDIGGVAVRLIMCEGRTVDEAVAAIGGTTSRARVIAKAQAHLQTLGMGGTHNWRRRAILDCPLEETKSIVWSLLTGEPIRTGAEPAFVELLRKTYLTRAGGPPWKGVWAREARLARIALGIFAAKLGRGEDLAEGILVDELARQMGCSTREAMLLAGGPSAGIRYRHVLENHEGDGRVLRPRQCSECSGWLLHVIRVPETTFCGGLVCATCHGLADGTPVPSGYLGLWDGPGGHQGRIDQGEGSRMGSFSDYKAPHDPIPGRARLIKIGEAARLTGLHPATLRRWVQVGWITSHRAGGQSARYFDREDLIRVAQERAVGRNAPRSKNEARAWPELLDDPAIPDGYLTLEQAAALLSVGIHDMRDKCLETPWDEGPLPYRRIPRRGTPAVVVAQGDVENLDQVWVASHQRDLLLIGAAARLAGVGAGALRRATDRKELAVLVTGGETRRYRNDDVVAWASGHKRRQ